MSDEMTLLPCPFCGSTKAPEISDVGECEECVRFDDCLHRQKNHSCEGCDEWERPMFVVCNYNISGCGTSGPYRKTRAEAIAAWNARTLSILSAKQVREAIYKNIGANPYNAEYYTSIIDHQTIADELNAELGGGNCARCAEDMGRYADSLCDPLKERIAELLRCLENDWHISASWDGLRKFWCIELTEEGVRMRDAACGTLTAEQVREAIERYVKFYEGGDYDEQAIADELNAELGSGTCELRCDSWTEVG